MIELERTFLLKYIPEGLNQCECKEIHDLYIPQREAHPTLRLRRSGNKFEMTKKYPKEGKDSSEQVEETIKLSLEEYEALLKTPGKPVRKLRYYYPYSDKILEVDAFQDDLLGLILVDAEFDNSGDKNNFSMPDFCLADVTQEEFVAGGKICGKKYEDIESELNRLEYKKLFL